MCPENCSSILKKWKRELSLRYTSSSRMILELLSSNFYHLSSSFPWFLSHCPLLVLMVLLVGVLVSVPDHIAIILYDILSSLQPLALAVRSKALLVRSCRGLLGQAIWCFIRCFVNMKYEIQTKHDLVYKTVSTESGNKTYSQKQIAYRCTCSYRSNGRCRLSSILSAGELVL